MLKNILNMNDKLQSQKLTAKKTTPWDAPRAVTAELLSVIESDGFCHSCSKIFGDRVAMLNSCLFNYWLENLILHLCDSVCLSYQIKNSH